MVQVEGAPLGATSDANLAFAMYKAAVDEHPQSLVSVKKDDEIVSISRSSLG